MSRKSRKLISVRGIITVVVVGFLLYWIIKSPDSAAVTFKAVGAWVFERADDLINFFTGSPS